MHVRATHSEALLRIQAPHTNFRGMHVVVKYSLRRLGRLLEPSTRAAFQSKQNFSATALETLKLDTTNQAVSLPEPTISPPAPQPTLPPRPPNVSDGRWDAADRTAVKRAQEDAAKIARQTKKFGAGEVILARDLEDLVSLASSDGQPSYRAKQLRDGVMRGARTVSDITTIPTAWRESLTSRGVSTGRSELYHEVAAPDGTRKFLLRLHDGYVVETVGIPLDDITSKPRLTVCVSSQVGCPMRCTFCATGKGKWCPQVHESDA
jgi:hypothetical protein